MAENKKNIPDAGKADEPPKLGKVEPAKAAPPVQEQPTPAKAEAPVVEDASKVVKPPTAEQPDKLVTCPSGPPPPRERHAEYCCLMTGQGNGRGAPKTFIKEETNMKYDPELAVLLAQPWSNNACRGYVIYAMENCGFSPADIRRVVAELHEVFDFCGLKETRQHFENSPY